MKESYKKDSSLNTTNIKLPIVILCGGKSSRMGEDKSLLSFNGKSSLAKYQYDRLKINFTNVYLSCKNNKFDFKAPLILDNSDVYSPLIALKKILESISSEKVFIITVDNPLIKLSSINKIISKSNEYEITVAKTKYLHSLCGVFSKSALPIIEQMIKEDFHKIGALLKQTNTKIINFEDENEFINLNNPSEYKHSLSLL